MCLPLARPLLGSWPATQACVLTGNRTRDPLLCRLGTQSTQPHQQGLRSSTSKTRFISGHFKNKIFLNREKIGIYLKYPLFLIFRRILSKILLDKEGRLLEGCSATF